MIYKSKILRETKEFNVEIVKDKYINNDTLYLGLFNTDTQEYFGDITVNVPFSGAYGNIACVDTNNNSNIIEFIKRYKLGKDTGLIAYSGYCTYPLYEFDMDMIDKYCKSEV